MYSLRITQLSCVSDPRPWLKLKLIYTRTVVAQSAWKNPWILCIFGGKSCFCGENIILYLFFSSLTLQIPTLPILILCSIQRKTYCLGRIYVNRYHQRNFHSLRLVTARVVWFWSLPSSSLSLSTSVSYESQINVDFNWFWIVLVWEGKCSVYGWNKMYAKIIKLQ